MLTPDVAHLLAQLQATREADERARFARALGVHP